MRGWAGRPCAAPGRAATGRNKPLRAVRPPGCIRKRSKSERAKTAFAPIPPGSHTMDIGAKTGRQLPACRALSAPAAPLQAQPAAEVVRHISRQRMPARGIAARPARAHGGARRGHSAPGAGAIVIAAGAGAQVDFSARRGCQAQCEAAVVLLAAVFAAARVQVANEAVLPHEFARNAQIRAARLQGAAGIGAQHGAPAAAALS